jgi:Na+/melibiose symporter-like transporter
MANRDVLGIGLADLPADANYEMVLAVLPLFITTGLGAPVVAVGLVEAALATWVRAFWRAWCGRQAPPLPWVLAPR